MESYPEIPNRLFNTLSVFLEDDQITEVWQSLCDEFGEVWAHHYQITIKATLTEED